MNRTEWAERTRQEIVRLCHAGLDSKTLKVQVMRNLKRVMLFDVAFFTTADPATLLFTGAMLDDVLARDTPQFLENEFLQDDPSSLLVWRAGARSSVP